MLTEIRVPLREDSGSAYQKVDRRAGDWAVVAAGASVTLEHGVIARAGLALAAVGSGVTCAEAEAALVGEPPSDRLFEDAARLAAASANPVSDQRGSAKYKRHAAAVLTNRALRRATERALRGAEA
jgi:carbon-monoxide dehydrogenase medium subunit